MKQHLISALAILLAFSAGFTDDQSTLTWTGCGISRKAYMTEAAIAYQAETGVRIILSGGGATKGIRDSNDSTTDMGGTCRPSLPDTFPQEEGNVYLTAVAWDALVAIVNEQNPVSNLTTAQLKKILTGEITNWSEVGGPDQKIVVVRRTGKISGVGMMTRQIIFGDLEAEYVAGAIEEESSGPLERRIETTGWSIGITGSSSAVKRSLKILTIDGIAPDEKNVSSGVYPFFRPMFIATKGKPEGEVKRFLDWLTSDPGQEVIEKVGSVSLRTGKGLKAKYAYWLSTDRIVNFDNIE